MVGYGTISGTSLGWYDNDRQTDVAAEISGAGSYQRFIEAKSVDFDVYHLCDPVRIADTAGG